MILTLAVFLRLAVSHAPSVAPQTLAAFAQHESGLNPNVIHDNTTRSNFYPATATAAAALATSLLAERHSLDLGLMQVNSANLARSGLTAATAFDPGESLRAGAQILVAAYQQCRHRGAVEEQAVLRCAASVYNTGKEQAGILNGYQAKVWRVAATLVPAIRTAATASDRPDDVVAPQPHPRPPAVFEDALHPAPPVSSDDASMSDAIHPTPTEKTP